MGILLLHMKDVNQKRLNQEKIVSHLNLKKNLRVNLEIFDQIDSTNSYLLKKEQSINTLNICVAEMQTKGKGRSGKIWESPKNSNIYLSIGTLLNKDISELDGFSILIALNICRALKNIYKIRAKVKWPNDLYLKGKKFGGILIETKVVNNKLALVIGIGLNVFMKNNEFIDQEWTSLHIENPLLKINRDLLISEIISEISKDLPIFLKKGFKLYKRDFEKLNILKNKKVIVSNYPSSNCIALDVNDDGSLNLLVDEIKRKVSSGEVSLKIQK
jgi:BirA family biotin operon repressor/biotin-[acetyl-CoA-carboxylase] ligase